MLGGEKEIEPILDGEKELVGILKRQNELTEHWKDSGYMRQWGHQKDSRNLLGGY